MLRVPQEPDPDRFPEHTKGVHIPRALDFGQLPHEPRARHDVLHTHCQACIQVALELSDLSASNRNVHHVRTDQVSVPIQGPRVVQLAIAIDTVAVAGASHAGLVGVRHVVTGIPLSPSAYMDGYNRVTYTDLVDKYTYLVELVEDCGPLPKTPLDWCHVAYTADELIPCIFAHRDFVTFDFVNHAHNLVVSRSCFHPAYPVTDPPTWWDCHGSRRGGRRLYRSPLFYFVRALPVPGDPHRCQVVQFQFSDVGGLVSIPDQVKAVIQFGTDNTPKVVAHLLDAVAQGIPLGNVVPKKDDDDDVAYMKDPLKPSWRQSANVMLGLQSKS